MYKVNNIEFKTKKEIEWHCKKIKKKYVNKEILNNEDFNFICDLKKQHHKEKIRLLEPEHIIIDIPEDRTFKQSRCFILIKNGTKHIFSVKKCIYNIGIKKNNVYAALRQAVKYQIEEFAKINNRQKGFHVDHIVHFTKLVEDWLNFENLNIEDLETIEECSHKKLKNSEIKQSWIDYHEKNAKLKIIPKKEI